jgi:hypothetical protein
LSLRGADAITRKKTADLIIRAQANGRLFIATRGRRNAGKEEVCDKEISGQALDREKAQLFVEAHDCEASREDARQARREQPQVQVGEPQA